MRVMLLCRRYALAVGWTRALAIVTSQDVCAVAPLRAVNALFGNYYCTTMLRSGIC
jgi:hypothetical protein